MNKTRHVVLATLATAITLPVIAEEQSPIIVTATRTAQTVDESLASVTVITKEDIAKHQATDLTDILNGIAGIDMTSSGGYGTTQSLYMRGTNTGHVLVMVDGVQIGSATLGQASYQDIPIDMIERIEIVRGARASLYGSEAIGGVIQIFTRQPTASTKLNYSSSFGTYQTQKHTAGISGKINKTFYALQASTLSSEGFNAKTDKNPDNDGYEQNSASLYLKHKFNNTDDLEFTVTNSNSINDYDGTTVTSDYYAEGLKQTIGIKSTFNANTNWQVILKANQSKDDSDSFKDDVKTSIYNTKRDVYVIQNNITLNENNLFTIGAENKNTSVDGTSTYSKNTIDNSAVFIQNNWMKNDNNLLFSVRSDNNEAFGTHTTGNIAWGQKVFSDIDLVLSAATAFKAPSFNDLYYPDQFGYVGNPDVLPETSENFEVSLKKNNFQLNIYRTNINNLISWELDTTLGKTTPKNIGQSRIHGIELLSRLNLAGWDTKINLSITDPVDTSTGKVLSNRSRESLRLDFDRAFSDYSLGATIKSQGARYTSTTTLESYTLFDLRARYSINKNWSLKAKVTNVFEEEYTLKDGYNTPGRSIFMSIHYLGL